MEVTTNKTDSGATKKKRQHYLSEFYLRAFVDPYNKPYVWLYEKGNKIIRKASPKDLCVLKEYYSFTTLEGEKDSETFENFLAMIETKVAPIFKKIEIGKIPEEDEKWWCSFFIAFMITRVPNFRDNVENGVADFIRNFSKNCASYPESFKFSVEQAEREKGKKLDKTPEELRKYILGDNYNIEVNPQFSLGMTTLARDLAPVLFKMKWRFLRATDEYKFVTCDNPVYRIDPNPGPPPFDGVGLLNRNIEVTFPVSKDLTILCKWEGVEQYIQTNNNQVKVINRRTISSASRFVFASVKLEGLNRLVQKYKDTAPQLVVT